MPPPAPAWRQKQASCCRVRVRRDISRCIRIKTRRARGSRRLRPSQCRARSGVRVLVERAAMRWVPSELIDRLMNNQWYALVSTISHMRIHTLSPAHTPSRDACDGALVRGRACSHRRPPSCSPVPRTPPSTSVQALQWPLQYCWVHFPPPTHARHRRHAALRGLSRGPSHVGPQHPSPPPPPLRPAPGPVPRRTGRSGSAPPAPPRSRAERRPAGADRAPGCRACAR